MIEVPADLAELHAHYRRAGFDIRFVGGCVRDSLLGETPKDFDLATDADLLEQADILKKHKVRFAPTGAAHGTLTLLLGSGKYEITTLRVDSAHDGRHAQVSFTRNWEADLARRDLTINAMALSFDGELLDPFNGAGDLAARRIRFVGDADQRIKEDYLRILRWLRFHARFAERQVLDPEAHAAMERNLDGLRYISRERVWQEMRKLITYRHARPIMEMMADSKLGEVIELWSRNGSMMRYLQARDCKSALADPVAMMAAWAGHSATVRAQAQAWRWSAEERERGVFLAHTVYQGPRPVPARELCALQKVNRAQVHLACLMTRDLGEAEDIATWDIPKFPVTGDDLIARLRMSQGVAIGEKLAGLKRLWADSDFTLTREHLLDKAS